MTKERPIIWIGGWASDVHCWEDTLEAALSGFRPRYVSAHTILGGVDRLQGLLDASGPGTVLAGWSLGGLLVERLLRDGRVPSGMPVVRICPFLDFCAPGGPWKPRVLHRMCHRLFGDAHGVLEDFADLAGIPAGPLRRVWLDQASQLGEENLAEGLELLGELRLSGPWAEAPGGFIVSPDDAVSPPTPTPPEATRVMPRGSAHVPFLAHPQAFQQALQELVGS